MLDTIDILEVIGRDASLRHTPPLELSVALERMNASQGLTSAVLSGDGSLLFAELGCKAMQAPQVAQV